MKYLYNRFHVLGCKISFTFYPSGNNTVAAGWIRGVLMPSVFSDNTFAFPNTGYGEQPRVKIFYIPPSSANQRAVRVSYFLKTRTMYADPGKATDNDYGALWDSLAAPTRKWFYNLRLEAVGSYTAGIEDPISCDVRVTQWVKMYSIDADTQS